MKSYHKDISVLCNDAMRGIYNADTSPLPCPTAEAVG